MTPITLPFVTWTLPISRLEFYLISHTVSQYSVLYPLVMPSRLPPFFLAVYDTTLASPSCTPSFRMVSSIQKLTFYSMI
ncbi:unnamed protein product [Protopolystoma xenopodis]|uniref:Uncharacterized protein n=1 Tax=Protopolystoma xenopodis TaxID=117903 RepID=A0A448XE94_9PLAT|nr:unnamed protein product [Protopolystoma xenopodis]